MYAYFRHYDTLVDRLSAFHVINRVSPVSGCSRLSELVLLKLKIQNIGTLFKKIHQTATNHCCLCLREETPRHLLRVQIKMYA